MDLEERLYRHVTEGDVDGARECLQEGSCVNFLSDDEGLSPLQRAVLLPQESAAVRMTELLLNYSALPGLPTAEGVSPLHLAAGRGREHLAMLLLAWGADASARDRQGKLPLEHVVGSGSSSEKLKNLLEEAVDVPKVSVAFHRYVFELDEDEKENIELPQKTTNVTGFLDAVQSIFLNDVSGVEALDESYTCFSPDVSQHKEDISSLAEDLLKIGFRTPVRHTPKPSIDGLSLERSAIDKVNDYLNDVTASGQEVHSTPCDKNPSAEFKTPMMTPLSRSYMRPTKSSSMKKQPKNLAESSTPQRKSLLASKTVAAAANKDKRREGAGGDVDTLASVESATPSIKTLTSCDSFHTAQSSSTVSTLSLAEASKVSVAQEFLHNDTASSVSLVERRLPSILGIALQDQAILDQLQSEAESAVGERSALTDLGSVDHLSASEVGRRLSEYGEPPAGPITSGTRRAYLIRLKKLRQGRATPSLVINSQYPSVMAESLKNISAMTRQWEALWDLEKEMTAPFVQVDAELAEKANFLTRDAVTKSSFNYLLLDPRKTQNLPLKVFSCGDQELWRTFVGSVFYIGKGTRSRPFQHLYEAARKQGKRSKKTNAKVDAIRDIWSSGQGVVSLQVFQNTIAVEGFAREAAMIQAIGLDNLCNVKPGDWYGPAVSWAEEDKLRVGTFLLFRAFKIFLQEGERQIRPADLKSGNK